MNEKPKFGDKSTGRSSIERLITWLEAYKLLYPLFNLIVLIILIGVNSSIRENTTNGIMFLILVFLILLGGNESTKNFFGASALAVFIILHISLFGFNSIALIISFLIFVAFRKRLERNLLGPISIYLLLDTATYYYNLSVHFKDIFSYLGDKIFSYEVVATLMVVPLAYIFLIFDRIFRKKFERNFVRIYGVFIVLGLLTLVFGIIGLLFEYKLYYYISGFFMLLYLIGTIQYKSNLRIFLFITLPLLIPVLLLSYFLGA